jgi:Tol biopolymer transport system component
LGASRETLSGATAKIFVMGAGVQAVKQKLNSGFGLIEFREMYDLSADSTLLAFESDGQGYSVRVFAGVR